MGIDVKKIIELAKKQKRAVILAVVGILVLVVSLSYGPKKSKQKANKHVKNKTVVTVPKISNPISPVVKTHKRLDESAPSNWGRNPFVPGKTIKQTDLKDVANKDSNGEFVLTGIVTNNKSAVALINKRIVREGDNIDGYKVQKILSDKVELLNKKGKNRTVYLRV